MSSLQKFSPRQLWTILFKVSFDKFTFLTDAIFDLFLQTHNLVISPENVQTAIIKEVRLHTIVGKHILSLLRRWQSSKLTLKILVKGRGLVYRGITFSFCLELSLSSVIFSFRPEVLRHRGPCDRGEGAVQRGQAFSYPHWVYCPVSLSVKLWISAQSLILPTALSS